MNAQKNDSHQKRLKEKFGRMVNACSEKLDKALFIAITSSLQRILDNPADNIEASNVPYIETLTDQIRAVAGEEESRANEKVEEVLWQYNFNSRRYFLYYIKGISNKVRNEETLGIVKQ